MTNPPEPAYLVHMSDALAAAALVAAILAAFFTIWQDQIQTALVMDGGAETGNWRQKSGPIYRAFWTRALPLFLIAAGAGGVLGPRTLGIAFNVLHCSHGCRYDDVQALFALTELLIVGLAGLTASQLCRLGLRLVRRK